jgi:hypothetical protein
VPFYEIMFETGRSSVAFYEDDAEAERAIGEHHRRAVNGEAGGPIGAPAERVAKVRVFAKHPNEYNAAQTMSGDVMEKEVSNLIKASVDENGVLSVDQLALQVRGLSHPMVIGKENTFDSNYLMKPDREMKLDFAKDGA